MTRKILSLIFAFFLFIPGAFAQQTTAFIQVEAQPSLTRAQESARAYADVVRDVNGFTVGGGWYAVALGPYTPLQALDILRNLRANGIVPRDAYVADIADYRSQFYPVGANVLNGAAATETAEAEPESTDELAQADTTATPDPDPEPEPEVAAEPEVVDETPRQARAGESRLTRDEKKALQVALQWAGFYEGRIDAAYGRGTRGAMSAWQIANGFDSTGVLTTLQRTELLRQYNSVLDGMGLSLVQDTGAGIEMMIPMDVVAFDKYEPPFAHYDATGNLDARVLLISQKGDRNTLGGLYDIMQTLEIVPEDGPRTLDGDAFTLIGENSRFVSHTQAWLKNGEVKGFSLIWPAGDEERRTRLLAEMQVSFTRIDGVLDPTAGGSEDQSVDLISGLEIRRPILSRSGFYVDNAGTVVTTSEVVATCGKITIDQDYEAEVVTNDTARGIAVLKPITRLAPGSVAAFQDATPLLQSDVAVAGYSYGGVLGAPTLTFGQLADLRGLNGEEDLKRLALAALDGDAGGPVIDAGGAVLGMLLPAAGSGKQLPDGVSFAADAQVVQDVLRRAGVAPSATNGGAQVPPETLTRKATGMTVLVSCWE